MGRWLSGQKGLPFRHEEMSSDIQSPHKSQARAHMPVAPRLEHKERGGSLELDNQLASLKTASSKFNETPCLKG